MGFLFMPEGRLIWLTFEYALLFILSEETSVACAEHLQKAKTRVAHVFRDWLVSE
jgi:hypothetical protein